ncbi:MAG: HEAT repeat domain-containing protein [Thiolinea sp.]
MTFTSPPDNTQSAIHGVLQQHLFAPVTEPYLSHDLLKKRLANTKSHLHPLLNNKAEWMAWLINSTYPFADEYNFHYELDKLLLKWIGETAQGIEVLFTLATQTDSEWYVQRKAIRILSEAGARAQLIRLLPPLLDYEDNTPPTPPKLYEVYEAYLDALAANKIREALPYLQQMQSDYNTLAELYLTESENYHADEEAACDNNYGDEDDEDLSDTVINGNAYDSYDIEKAQELLTIARAALGDSEALVAVIRLSYNDWHHTREPARAALRSLLDTIGDSRALQQLSGAANPLAHQDQYQALSLQHEDGFVRTWALDRYIATQTENDGTANFCQHLIRILEDDNWHLRMAATEQLIAVGNAALPIINKALKAEATILSAKYSLLYVLVSLKQDIKALLPQIEDAFVPLPDFIPPAIRSAIVRTWGGSTEPGTDIRWLTEHLLTTSDTSQPEYQAEVAIKTLVTTLETHGIAVDEAIDYAEQMQQGSSTFFIVKMAPDDITTEMPEADEDEPEKAVHTRSDWINLSQLAPYAFYERHETVEYFPIDSAGIVSSDFSSASSFATAEQNNEAKYRKLVADNGFTWLTDQQLEFIVPGLHIYFFGDREPLSIRDLLFYWQD